VLKKAQGHLYLYLSSIYLVLRLSITVQIHRQWFSPLISMQCLV